MTDQGPDAPYTGPEAPAWVAELLAGLPADDPPIPEDVAARLDATISELATSAPGPGLSGHDTPHPGAEPAPTGAADVVSLPSPAARHATRANPWPHRLLLGGVAAAAVLVLGGLSTLAVLRGSTPTTDGAVSAGAGADAQGHGTSYVASGASYTSSNLAATTGALLRSQARALSGASPTGEGVAPLVPSESSVSQGSAPPGSTSPGTITEGSAAPTSSPPAARVLELHAAASRPQPSCLQSLAGAPDVAPLVVDEATYDAHPAFVVVFATAGDAATVDVWVVARTCAEGNEGLYTFARVAR